MKTIKLFAALCVIAALGVSCRKEVPVQNEEEQIVVPEGMEYVSFEIGAPEISDGTKISGAADAVKWNSAVESVAVVGILNGEQKIYKFDTTPHYSDEEGKNVVWPTTTISCSNVDTGASLYCVIYPYSGKIGEADPYTITVEDGQLKTIEINKQLLRSIGYANTGVSSNTLYACKVSNSNGTYSAASNLYPLLSFIKVTVPQRDEKDKLKEGETKGLEYSSYISKITITGPGLTNIPVVDFSGDKPVTSLKNTSSLPEGTITASLKNNTRSLLPTAGDYLIPVLPIELSSLTITAQYFDADAKPTVNEMPAFANYSVTYGPNSFTQGKYKSVTIAGPYVASLTTSSAIVDGTTLTMQAAVSIETYGKVTAEDYVLGFNYREKGAEGWTYVAGDYADGGITKAVAVTAGKTYEVKAYAAAKGALKDGDGVKDQVREGDVVESKGYVPPIVVTINKFGTAEFDGINTANHWDYVGDDKDFVFVNQDNKTTAMTARKDKDDPYDYYDDVTSPTPTMSGIKICAMPTKPSSGSNYNTYYFSSKMLLHYGSGYIEFPGKTGYKISKVVCNVNASSAVGKNIVATKTSSTSKSTSVVGTSGNYSEKNVKEDLILICDGDDDDGVKVWPNAAFNYNSFEITYSAN